MNESPINVLYITHTTSKYTGSNKSLLALLENLKLKNVSPLVIVPKRDNMSLTEELERLTIPYIVLSYYMPIYPSLEKLKDYLFFFPKLIRSMLFNLRAEKQIYQIAKNSDINLIHTNVGPILLGHKVAKKIGLPHIWHIREFQDLDFNLKTWYSKNQFQSLLSEENNYPIAISDSVYKHFDLKSPACVIYNGILKSSQARFIDHKLDYFLFAGYLRESKGISNLLNAFSSFHRSHPRVKLLIAGHTTDKTYKSFLEQLAVQLAINDAVEFLGQRDDISNLMSNAIALVVPSLNEAFGRVTAEAMFNGCLVIGKNSSGTREIIERIGVGFLYEDEEELADIMKKVVDNIEQYKPDLITGLNRAVSSFSIDASADSVNNIYAKVLAN